ncbi:hypothetical protein ACFQI7_10915 [Paenibacillus allorhizosphaerae]|uniref:Uncharacterized protein n=1 Tax=Paenibacillus allorhizosphaerae TaxID=2849866 RepID=A0ABM8VHR0_9BACL|nr:hypothetical protein [Paenibacillus allorhizosphaerae]CAG7642794.1 hypothetical protein PAECIP111802_02904 [Paenibacillus allorhizosphaerae]
MKPTNVPNARLKRLLTPAALSVLLLLAACSGPESSPPGDPGLMVKLSFSRKHVMIDNGNDFVWKDASMEINNKFRYVTALLPRGASSIPLSEFRDEDGHPFDPQQGKPHRLTLQVKEGAGGKPGTWVW